VSDISDDARGDTRTALIKVHATSSNRAEIKQLVDIFRAQTWYVSLESMTIEITGTEDKVDFVGQHAAAIGQQRIGAHRSRSDGTRHHRPAGVH
jgi:acetolactate synthase-1/3 small subunit